jgi:MoxR-like ATPase
MPASLGAQLTARQLVATLEHIFTANLATEAAGGRSTPVCVWGPHGIGKTMIVEDFARGRGWQFAMLSPAQFEEMGDLNGLPVLTEDRHTAFAPPSWVPGSDGPGVLLIDDINRADDRILRGLMQLLSEGRLASWALPPRWQIVATANPEGELYSVTPMDDAMLTRMMHVTLAFDALSWESWARRQHIDERCIEFVVTYPETVTGRRTTPRSLTQFFRAVAAIPDLTQDTEMVRILGLSTLDDGTVGAFLSYLADGAMTSVSALEILDATDFEQIVARLKRLVSAADGSTRMDQLSVVCARLARHLTDPDYQPTPRHADNLVRFLVEADLPKDLVAGLHRDLASNGSGPVKEMMRDKRVARFVLSVL